MTARDLPSKVFSFVRRAILYFLALVGLLAVLLKLVVEDTGTHSVTIFNQTDDELTAVEIMVGSEFRNVTNIPANSTFLYETPINAEGAIAVRLRRQSKILECSYGYITGDMTTLTQFWVKPDDTIFASFGNDWVTDTNPEICQTDSSGKLIR